MNTIDRGEVGERMSGTVIDVDTSDWRIVVMVVDKRQSCADAIVKAAQGKRI